MKEKVDVKIFSNYLDVLLLSIKKVDSIVKDSLILLRKNSIFEYEMNLKMKFVSITT